MPKKKRTPGSYEDRTTMGPGQGVIVTPPSKPKPKSTKSYVAGPRGRELTEDEALELGRKLWDDLHGQK